MWLKLVLIIKRKGYVIMKTKIGWGTASIGILILAILFSINLSRTFCLGDVVLKGLGLKVFSAGDGLGMHNTIFYSGGMLFVGYFVGRIFSKDFGAKVGRRICGVLGIGFLLILVMLVPANVYMKG
jgi:hypothetical protein